MSEHDYQMIAWAIAVVLYIADFIIRVCLLIYIPKNRKPTAAMSWLLLIFIIPLFGTILFFILGSTKLSRRRRRQQTQINQMLKRYTTELKRKGLVAKVGKPHDIQARLGEAFTSLRQPTAIVSVL